MGQRFSFGFADSLLAEVAGVPQAALHTDVDAMVRAAEAMVPLAERLGVQPPRPHLAGLTYVHASTLGCEVAIPAGAPEPSCKPCLHSPADVDRLAEPADYLAAGIVPERLELVRRLKARRPGASDHIGHDFEGPVTTAVLLMGQDFFMLPHDDPDRAHRLLEFCVRSALNYAHTLRHHQGRPFQPGRGGFCDDFGGIFPPETFREFVLPYWEKMYRGIQATRRGLHSELLREQHLPFLTELKINEYDPSVDPYLPPEVLKKSCPVPFTLRIWPAEVMSRSAAELVEMYRCRATFEPTVISFHLARLSEEHKIATLLKVARELA